MHQARWLHQRSDGYHLKQINTPGDFIHLYPRIVEQRQKYLDKIAKGNDEKEAKGGKISCYDCGKSSGGKEYCDSCSELRPGSRQPRSEPSTIEIKTFVDEEIGDVEDL